MADGLSEEDRTQLAELSRRRSLRLLLVVLVVVAALELVSVVVSSLLNPNDDPTSRRTDQLVDVAIWLGPLAVAALIGLVLYLRNRPNPLLLLGADPKHQRQAQRAMREGRASDGYIDALATDFAIRQARQWWTLVAVAITALLALILFVVGPQNVRVVGALLLVTSAIGGWSWWINRRRARRYLVDRSSSAT